MIGNDDKHAFPCLGDDGMALRDWFAGMALSGMTHKGLEIYDLKEIVQACYTLSDMMMKERDKDEERKH